MRNIFCLLLIFNMYDSFSSVLMEVRDPKIEQMNNLVKKKEILVKMEKPPTDFNHFVIVVKKNADDFKFKIINVFKNNLVILRPLNDFNANNICNISCEAKLLPISPQEELDIYYRFRPLQKSDNQIFFSELIGGGDLRYGVNGNFSIDGESFLIGYSFGGSLEKYFYKKNFNNFLFGITTGIGLDILKIDLSKFNFSYMKEDLKDSTFLNFSAPVSFHFNAYRYFEILLGWSFNALLIPISNEATSNSGDFQLSSVTSLTGGFSLGYHAGINFAIGNWFVKVMLSQYKCTISEDEVYDEVVNNQVVTKRKLTQNYDASVQQIFAGIGILF